jgi:hypothetical protein
LLRVGLLVVRRSGPLGLLVAWRNGLVVGPILLLRVVGTHLLTRIIRTGIIGPAVIGLVHLWRILTVLLLLVSGRNWTPGRLRRLLAVVRIYVRLISRTLLDSALIAGYNGGGVRSRRAERRLIGLAWIGLPWLIRLIGPIVGSLISIALRCRELIWILRTATIRNLTGGCCHNGASRQWSRRRRLSDGRRYGCCSGPCRDLLPALIDEHRTLDLRRNVSDWTGDDRT